MKFDKDEMQQVARVLHITNPSAKAYTIDHLVEYMCTTAERELTDKCSYVATLGFCLTSYVQDWGGILAVKATLTAWGIEQYLKRTGALWFPYDTPAAR